MLGLLANRFVAPRFGIAAAISAVILVHVAASRGVPLLPRHLGAPQRPHDAALLNRHRASAEGEYRGGGGLMFSPSGRSCCMPEAPAMTDWGERIARPLRALHLDSIRNKILALAVLATLIPRSRRQWSRTGGTGGRSARRSIRSSAARAPRRLACWTMARRAARRSARVGELVHPVGDVGRPGGGATAPIGRSPVCAIISRRRGALSVF